MCPPFPDPDQRLYVRKQLCQALGLQGMVFAGRLPSLRQRLKKFTSVEDYVEAIRSKEQKQECRFAQ